MTSLGEHYKRDARLNLFQRVGSSPFSYSDGLEVEARIRALIAACTDRGTFSSELHRKWDEWPLEYHLSAQRHCILRPLGIRPGDRVLEVGCGCGALTRYLGELRADVLALEGAPTRAAIAAERCADLPNVCVVADDFLNAKLEGFAFDWVIMVGVLEYAHVYSTSLTAAQDYLARAAQLRAQGGRIVVAIENKLGTKYLNGAEEDHVGKPAYGLQGLYRPQEPRTYGRRELVCLFNASKLPSPQFWYPFPDYKLPDAIISETALDEPSFHPAEILAKTYARDYSKPNPRHFIEPLAYRELARNGLLGELSNSFLAVSSVQRLETDVMATTFAMGRRPPFVTETKVQRTPGGLRVRKARFSGSPTPEYRLRVGLVRQHIDDEEAYVQGELAIWPVTEARARDETNSDELASAFKPWFDFLLSVSSRVAATEQLSEISVDGEFLDCTPFNLVKHADGYRHIDREWVAEKPIPLGWVVVRSLISCLLVLPGLEKTRPTLREVANALCAASDLRLEESDLDDWISLERENQRAVSGLGEFAFSAEDKASILATVSEDSTALRDEVLASVAEVAALRETKAQLAARELTLVGDVTTLQSETEELRRTAQTIEASLRAEREALQNLDNEAKKLRDDAWEYRRALDDERRATQHRTQQLAEANAELEGRLTQIDHLVTELQTATEEAAGEKQLSRQLTAELGRVIADHRREKYTVVRPLYRNLFKYGGRIARQLLPASAVVRMRNLLPDPDGAPNALRQFPLTSRTAAVPEVSGPSAAPDVFVLSIINWDFRYQRPQQLATRLGRKHRVFYVEMEMEGSAVQTRHVADNVYVVRLPTSRIGHVAPYSGRPSKSQTIAWIEELYRLCERAGSTSQKHVIIEHPWWWQFARHLSADFNLVFDCMDDIGGFSNTEPFLLELEKDMVASCDKLIVSSQHLAEKHGSGRQVATIRNGGDVGHFARDQVRAAPSFLKKAQGSINVGYVGAIAEWFDVGLVRAVAASNPDFAIHLCGAVTTDEAVSLRELPNIHLYGEIPYEEVPGFLEGMDVLTIPFRLLPIIQACDPVKFYEYSSMGKPTVSTRLPELARASKLVFFASEPDEFAAQVRTAARADDELREALRDYARANTWDDRCAELEVVLSSEPKVSVVILSYGDPALAEATLWSLAESGGHYPNLEVIVVDNGSSDEDLLPIEKVLSHFPDSKLIRNRENLGFAKGNNVGIEAASGEYVLLLNNDTFVSPGAVRALVRQLQSDPAIGVVGPLTNNIGNEAKLDVNYANMTEMKVVARHATTGYRRMRTNLRVAAYFAAMFRRRDFERFGRIPTDYGVGMFEDDDHCALIHASGYEVALAEDAFVHHHLSATFNSSMTAPEKQKLFEANKQKYEKKWGPWAPHSYRDRRPASTLDIGR